MILGTILNFLAKMNTMLVDVIAVESEFSCILILALWLICVCVFAEQPEHSESIFTPILRTATDQVSHLN